jgi:hypothetical protein
MLKRFGSSGTLPVGRLALFIDTSLVPGTYLLQMQAGSHGIRRVVVN